MGNITQVRRGQRDLNAVSRRNFLRTATAIGTAAVAAPFVVGRALATSGELNFMGWAGYAFKGVFDAFTAKTGIKVNFTEQPDQDAFAGPSSPGRVLFLRCRPA